MFSISISIKNFKCNFILIQVMAEYVQVTDQFVRGTRAVTGE